MNDAEPDNRIIGYLFRVKNDQEGFGIYKGDKIVCVASDWDPVYKLTVCYRESDLFDPQMNIYREDVHHLESLIWIEWRDGRYWPAAAPEPSPQE
jgi:hypothetical protein